MRDNWNRELTMHTKNKSQQGKNLGIRKKVNASHLKKESKYYVNYGFLE